MEPRGIRNNNPGNIRRTGEAWRGLANRAEMNYAQRLESEFLVFAHVVYGIRAIARILTTYQRVHSCHTCTAIISRYAPDSENNTAAYIQSVAGAIGVQPDEPIDLANPFYMYEMVKAIITHECGKNPYTYEIPDGLLLAAN